jgi:hypothetical protein
MRAAVVIADRPFAPPAALVVRRPRRIRSLAPRTRLPVICLLNGRPLLRAGWRRRLRHGDHVAFVALPLDQGSNPLRLLASLALMAFAPWAAGLLLGTAANTVLFGAFTLGQATQLGIILAGQVLINALLPLPQPGEMAAPSPTYTLQAQGNAARIEAPVPVQYGRHLSWPDFAAQPYTEFHDNEQYLYQLLCLGAGHHDIEAIRIEDTPIASFNEIETEVVGPGGTVTLFPTAVISSVEVSGQTFRGRADATWARSGTVVTLTETAHSRAIGQAVQIEFGGSPAPATAVYTITAVPDADTFRVTAATGAGSGPAIVRTVLGGAAGFTAAGPGTVATHLAADIVMPRGLFGGGGSSALEDRTIGLTFQARRIDDAGAPLAAWFELGQPTFTDRTTTPQRRSIRWALGVPGRYAVRAWRRDAQEDEAGAGHEAGWAGLRSYLREAQDWGPVTLIALRMKATNNLSLQAGRRISVIATRRLPVWNGTSWSAPVATRSIAWALADAARDPDYGAGLADARIDLPALLALDAVWTARGDRFDARFDQEATWWEALGRIAAAGRARPYMQGGRLRVVRDGPQSVPVALYSMRNIVRGSFAIDYLLPTAQSSRVADVVHFDAETWSQRRVRVSLPGEASARPAKIEMFGITGRDHAAREGLYHLAASRYRRRLVRFSTEMEGFIPALGDLIAVSHDMPGWGAQAEAVGWDAGARRLRLSEPLTFGPGGHYVGLRRPDGSLSGPWAVTPGADPAELVLADLPDFTPETGSRRERTHVTFGTAGAWRVLARVAAIRPRSDHEVEIEAVIEDPAVHAADTGAAPAPIVLGSLPGRVTVPAVGGHAGRRGLSCRNGRGHRPRRPRRKLDPDRRHLLQLLRRADPLSRAHDHPRPRRRAGGRPLGRGHHRHADPRHVEHRRHADVDIRHRPDVEPLR